MSHQFGDVIRLQKSIFLFLACCSYRHTQSRAHKMRIFSCACMCMECVMNFISLNIFAHCLLLPLSLCVCVCVDVLHSKYASVTFIDTLLQQMQPLITNQFALPSQFCRRHNAFRFDDIKRKSLNV